MSTDAQLRSLVANNSLFKEKHVMNSWGLRKKLMVLLVVPILGLLGLAIHDVWNRWAEYENAKDLVALVELATDASALVHELQKERGLTAGYIGSNGQRFAGELPAQQQQTDARHQSLKARVERFDFASQNAITVKTINDSMAKMTELATWRSRARALDSGSASAVGEYTAANGLFLDMIGHMAAISQDPRISRLMVGYVNLLRSKEKAGIIRAVLTNAFTVGTFKGHEALYSQLVTEQGGLEAHGKVFLIQATQAQREFYHERMQSADAQQAVAMLNRAREGLTAERLDVDPGTWFAAQTKRIDQLKTVEDRVSADLLAQSAGIKSQSLLAMGTLTVIVLVLLAITVVFGFVLVRGIVTMVIEISGRLDSAAEQLREAAQQVSGSSQSLAEGSSEQAASLEETSSTLEEISTMTKQNADHTVQVEQMVGNAQENARKGGSAMGQMVERINAIKESSDKTAKIIKTIDEIAFQTNLLALNAAVEAARAGDAGRGFAVVAEEVRNLALRSAQAAKDTSTLIEESQQRAEQGVSASSDVQALLQEILKAVDAVNGVVQELSAASKEQSRGVEQITTAVSQMDQVTQSNAANAEENAAASEELASQSTSLMAVVDQLKVLVLGGRAADGNGLHELRAIEGNGHDFSGSHAARGNGAQRTGSHGAGGSIGGKASGKPQLAHHPAPAKRPAGKGTSLGLKEKIEQDQEEHAPVHLAGIKDLDDADFRDIK
jgi:methyl-accepting chemotaxis protein